MANSMTGFGRGEASGSGYQFSIELKSVNHRFLEIMVRTTRNFSSFEERIRKTLQGKFQRGRIEVHVNVVETEGIKRLAKVDNDLALSYDKILKDLALTLQAAYFDSHLAQGRDALRSNDSVGRRLDFLVQEMNREINTIGSKANDLKIGQQVVSVKSELEKVREQIQNLE